MTVFSFPSPKRRGLCGISVAVLPILKYTFVISLDSENGFGEPALNLIALCYVSDFGAQRCHCWRDLSTPLLQL